MKKIISLVLIFLLTLNSFGFLAYYFVEIESCKIEAVSCKEEYHDQTKDEEFDKHDLLRFFSGQKGVQVLDGKEIRYEGRMYDIVSIQKIDGKEIYLAYGDKREDECVKNVSDLTKENSSSNSLTAKNILNDLLKYISSSNNCFTCEFPVKQASTKNYEFVFCFYESPLKNIFSPPPNNSIS